MKHVHSELIKAWADGVEIEYFSDFYQLWEAVYHPLWDENVKYRIKPTPKPDMVRYVYVCQANAGSVREHMLGGDNLKLTFDGETGKLKSAEGLK